MSADPRHYLSYLLRLWQEPAARPGTWRASLENSQTGELLGFANVAQLIEFLGRQLDSITGAFDAPPDPRTRTAIAETGGDNDCDQFNRK